MSSTPSLSGISLRLWRFLQSPQLLFYVLLYFMALLVAGTIAQKYLGLFQATHLYFNSFFLWLGPVPLPAGASVLGLLFVNLLLHFVTKSQWGLKQMGTTLAHLSVLILLLGGGITLFEKQEGFMVLPRNTPVVEMYDYHKRGFSISERGHVFHRADPATFKDGQKLQLPPTIPFSVEILSACTNCATDAKNTRLIPMKTRLDDEVNRMGLLIRITPKGEKPKDVAMTEFEGTLRFRENNKNYGISLYRVSRTLPFSLLLTKLDQDYYAGTDVARNYSSSLDVTENDRSWPALISMNHPLRYKGYTFYQSSVLNFPDGESASVLNVVDNVGWLFPYLATFLLFAGLALHAGVRLYGKK